MSDDEKLIGKTIVWAQIGGYGVRLKFSDGSILDYTSSDGGYSCWDIIEGTKQTEMNQKGQSERMTKEDNIRAILETHFSGFKEELIDSAVNRLMEVTDSRSMIRYLDADKLEKDGWTMQRIRQDSPTEMVCETRKPTDFPAADVVSQGTVDQIRWERDLALSQLESIGKGLGSKMDDVAEVQHGRWLTKEYMYGDPDVGTEDMWIDRLAQQSDYYAYCSICGKDAGYNGEGSLILSDYCPHCGALMMNE